MHRLVSPAGSPVCRIRGVHGAKARGVVSSDVHVCVCVAIVVTVTVDHYGVQTYMRHHADDGGHGWRGSPDLFVPHKSVMTVNDCGPVHGRRQ